MVVRWIHCLKRGWLLGLVTFFLVCACTVVYHPASTQVKFSTSVGNVSKASSRLIKHAMGETWIPVHPQRVVILHGFLWEDAIALGFKPVGAAVRGWASITPPQISLEQLQGVVDVGYVPTNIEKVLALKPDLILGTFDAQKDIYPLLSHIAPTVIVQINIHDWKDHFIRVAEALDKTKEAQKVLTDYDSRLQKFRDAMGDRLSKTRLSVIGFEKEICWLFNQQKNSFSYGILSEVGLIHTTSLNQNIPMLDNYLISWERVDEIDGNVIFVTTFAFRKEEETQKNLQRLQSVPLWFKLKAVQNNKVYRVGVYWIGNGPLAANRVINDLFKYLFNKS
ncbi:iron-siderophore ABC transporter substrate-binding protein [Nostoc sp.]|uniref:iron-siderophore ABC transporter substrate-binding protein n=1 Tax=Nostoc sp. TaxID=1180 RepID=UPI002FFA8BE5